MKKFFIVFWLVSSVLYLWSHGGSHEEGQEEKTTPSADHSSHGKDAPKSSIPIVAEELARVGIEERIGDFINGDLSFYNSLGEKVFLKDLIQDKPVVLTFAYYSCPLFCQYVLQAEEKALSELALTMGSDYDAITISFDERDREKATFDIKEKYVNNHTREHWSFLYGDGENIKEITDSMGFQFKWIPENQEFAHSAAIFVVTPKGKISRYFYGLNYDPFELKLALLEAKEEKTRSAVEKIILYCYRYDHNSRGYVVHAQNVMKLGGVATIIIMGGFLVLMFKREKRGYYNEKKGEAR